jgi:hypothetical protein
VEETDNSRRLKRYCTVHMCEDVLVMLAAFGLMVPDRTVPPPRADLGVWRSTDRFRAHVGSAGAPFAWQTMNDSPGTAEPNLGADEEEGS